MFNVGGNKYRLIAIVSYPKRKVYIQHVLTHKSTTVARGKATEVRPADRASDRYFVLIQELLLSPLRSNRELDRAIAMIDRLLARGGLAGDEEDYLDVLSDLVEKYEEQHYPIEPVSASTLSGTWSSRAARRRRPSPQRRGCRSRRCRRSSWADAGSIPGTSASWPATSGSIRASFLSASRVGCVWFASTVCDDAGGGSTSPTWTVRSRCRKCLSDSALIGATRI